MKKRLFPSICIVIAAALACAPLAAAQDFTFIGDFCWTEPDGGTIRLGVSQVGSGHLQINGGIYLPPPDNRLDGILTGSGEFAADGIHLGLSQSATGDTFLGGTWHMVLSKKTLNGTGEAVLHYYDKVAMTMDTVFDSRPLTKIPCP